ncbi:hypothetical protein QBC44DRAFT_369547 [Cladorrhinum sp. PSN332]|nr:hypothetical protein QBC44DRAFT_369547 [Cladorrhinum sp. PSN332]
MSLSFTSTTPLAPIFMGPHHTVPTVFPDHNHHRHHHHDVKFAVPVGGAGGGHTAYHCRVDLSDLLERVHVPSGCREVHIVGRWDERKEVEKVQATVTVFVAPSVGVTSVVSVTVTEKDKETVTEKDKKEAVTENLWKGHKPAVPTYFPPGGWGKDKGKAGRHHGLEGRQVLDQVLEGVLHGGKSTLVRSVLTSDSTVEWPTQETYDLGHHQSHSAHPYAVGFHPVRVGENQEAEQSGFEEKWIGKSKGSEKGTGKGKGKENGFAFGGIPEHKKSIQTGVLRIWPSRPTGGVRSAKSNREIQGAGNSGGSQRGDANSNSNNGNNGGNNSGNNNNNNGNSNSGNNSGNNNGNTNGNTNGNGQTGTTSGTTPCSTTSPLLDISVDLLGLPIDVELYLDIANGNNNGGGGLLGTVSNVVGGLLGGLLGGSSSSSRSTIITDGFTSRCGQGLTGIANGGNNSGTTGLTTAADARQCLQLCQRAGILLTVQIGELNDCLGVTLRNGIAVDNCLYFLGAASDILDLNLELGDVDGDVFLNQVRAE